MDILTLHSPHNIKSLLSLVRVKYIVCYVHFVADFRFSCFLVFLGSHTIHVLVALRDLLLATILKWQKHDTIY